LQLPPGLRMAEQAAGAAVHASHEGERWATHDENIELCALTEALLGAAMARTRCATLALAYVQGRGRRLREEPRHHHRRHEVRIRHSTADGEV
jgi:hypothetical protein